MSVKFVVIDSVGIIDVVIVTADILRTQLVEHISVV